MSRMEEKTARDLLSKKNVNGFSENETKIKNGKDTGEECTTVFVEKKVPLDKLKTEDVVPERIEDVKTDVVALGEIKAEQIDRKSRVRPPVGSISIGGEGVTAGTLGTLVYKTKEIEFGDKKITIPEPYILTNHHVAVGFATNRTKIGKDVYQPGLYDGADKDKDVIGTVEDYNLFRTNDFYEYDAAIVKPTTKVLEWILDAGVPEGIETDVKKGDKLHKSGRTTQYTEGEVRYTNATVNVRYDKDTVLTFKNQIICEDFSAPGDSGSCVWKGNKACALLFAGSDSVTVVSPIKPILDRFGVSIVSY